MSAGLTGMLKIPPYLLFKLRRGAIVSNEILSSEFLTLQERLVKAEASLLGLIYNGPQLNRCNSIEFFLVTDPQNMSTFAVLPGEDVAAGLRKHRAKFDHAERDK